MFEAEEETCAWATDRKAPEVFWKNRRNGRGQGCGQKSYLGLTVKSCMNFILEQHGCF